MVAPQNPNSDWIIVSSRRHRRRGLYKLDMRCGLETPTQEVGPPFPWTPSEPSSTTELKSELLSKIQSALRRLESSRFYARVLAGIRCTEVQSGLSRALSSDSGFPMVIYGIGSIASFDSPRLQLALALLLRNELPVRSIEVFDPALSWAECAVLETLGVLVLKVNEMARRRVSAPTMFYMPHCDAALYDNLLEANWRPESLNRIVLLGNSFEAYEQHVMWAGESRGPVPVKVLARYVMAARRSLQEVALDEAQEEGLKRSREEKDEEYWVEKAFGDTKWHFFEMDEAADMDFS